jgi:3',5'-cyclic AMP phosphodiesterase CpdA
VKGDASAAHSSASGNPDAGSLLSRGWAEDTITLAGITLVADPAGAMYWPDEKLLAVADLHLEKGSAFAARGVLLPPYDTATTLARLARLVERYAPRAVIALGDSFHDGGGPARMDDISRVALKALQRGRDWVWIAGNHDPDPAENIGGRFADVTAERRRNRRPSASGGAGGAARPRGEPALLRGRYAPPRHAGLWCLCRRPQCARRRHRVGVRRAVFHRAYARRRTALRRSRIALLSD